MILAKTLNDVILSREKCVPTGSVHEFEDSRFEELEGLKAVRHATVEETALYRREHGSDQVAAAEVTAAEVAAAEVAAAEVAAADGKPKGKPSKNLID